MESVDLNMEDIFDQQDADINDLDDDFPTASRVLPDLPPEEADQGDDQDAENSEVLSRLRDMSKGAAKSRVYRPQPKLDATRLTGERGLPLLPKLFNGIKFKGKGHEAEDLRTVMNKYEHWAHRLFPKMTFDEVIERAERLGKKAAIQVRIKRVRLDMPLNPEEGAEGEGEVEGEAEPAADRSRIELDDDMDAEEAFDAIMRDDNEKDNTDKSSAHSQPSQTAVSQPAASQPLSSSQKPTQKAATGLTDEQLERIERNKRLAQERRAAKLGLATSTPPSEHTSNSQATLPVVNPSIPDTDDENNTTPAETKTDNQTNDPSQPASLDKLFSKSVGTWECATCLVENGVNVDSCVACSAAKTIPGNDKPDEISSIDLKSKSSTAGLSELFRKPAGNWNCDACMVENKPEVVKCIACGTTNSSSDAAIVKPNTVVKDASAGDNATPSLSALFSKAAGSWNCDVCMVQNKLECSKCVACGTSNNSSANSSTNTNSLTKVTADSANTGTSLSSLFTKPAGSWNCEICMVSNTSECSKCVACGTVNTSSNVTINTSTLSKDTGTKDNSAPSLSSLFAKPAGSWSCDVCMVENKGDSSECVACGTANASAGATKPPANTSSLLKFSKPSGSWDCDGCLLQNTASATKCVACDTLKPGAVAAGTLLIAEGALSSGKGFQINPSSAGSTTGGFKFGSSTAASSTTSGFKFGSSTTASSATTGFKFGSSSESATNSSGTGGFTFGSSSTDATTGGFKFGSSSTDAASTGSTTSGFRFGSSTDAPAVASTGSVVKETQDSENMELDTDNQDSSNQNNNNYLQENLPPAYETLAPADNAFVPVNGTLESVDETLPPVDDTLPPADETLPPADETLPPADETLPPVDETLPPVDETVPLVNGTSALVDETLPPGDETLPPVNETLPSIDETLPPLQFYEDSEEQTSTQPHEDMDIAD